MQKMDSITKDKKRSNSNLGNLFNQMKSTVKKIEEHCEVVQPKAIL